MGINAYCSAGTGCGRRLDADVYDAAELMGLDATYIRARLPMKCRECGNRNVRFKLANAPRSSQADDAPPNMRTSRNANEVERARVLIAEVKRGGNAV